MKRIMLMGILILCISGCAFGARQAERWIIDKDYETYKQRESEIEKQYLDGFLTYAEYVERMDQINQDRVKSEQARHDIVVEK